jgi:hypothetical protein
VNELQTYEENRMVNLGKQTTRASKQNLGNNTKQTRPSNSEVTSW